MEFHPEVLDDGRKRVYNCDVYCGTLVDGDGGITLKDVQQLSIYHA